MRKVNTRRALSAVPTGGFVEVVQSDKTQDKNAEPQHLAVSAIGSATLPAGSTAPVYFYAAADTVIGPGAASVNNFQTNFETTGGTPDVLTLADGSVFGQMKKIFQYYNATVGGIVTPANMYGGTSVDMRTFAGSTAIFMWVNESGGAWAYIEGYCIGDSYETPTIIA